MGSNTRLSVANWTVLVGNFVVAANVLSAAAGNNQNIGNSGNLDAATKQPAYGLPGGVKGYRVHRVQCEFEQALGTALAAFGLGHTWITLFSSPTGSFTTVGQVLTAGAANALLTFAPGIDQNVSIELPHGHNFLYVISADTERTGIGGAVGVHNYPDGSYFLGACFVHVGIEQPA